MREPARPPRAGPRSRFGLTLLVALSLPSVVPLATAGPRATVQPAGPGRPPGSPARVHAETLLWPLETRGPILSSFGEYRYDHLHAGVDISTGGGTGFKVLAAAAGEVFRLKVEWRGYGRALYLRHPGGRVTVYGHLERYEDRVLGLEKLVARRQASAGTRYPGDIYLERPIPVRRGQLIAYSGESGVGLPHLHFEVRDGSDAPLDPFLAGLPRPADSRPPVLESLIVTSGAASTFIDGDSREVTLPMKSVGGRSTTARPIRVSGPFLAALSTYDPAGDSGRSGVGTLAVTVDGQEIYRLAPRTFRFDQYPQAGLVFDHRYSRLSPAAYAYRLERLPGNELVAAASGAEADPDKGYPGAIDLAPGLHWMDIAVDDASSNRSRARVCIEVAHPPPAESLEWGREVDSASVRFRLSSQRDADPRPSRPDDAGTCATAPRGVEAGSWDERAGEFTPMACRLEDGVCEAAGHPGRGGPAAVRLRGIQGGVPGPWRLLTRQPPAALSARDLALDIEAWPASLDVLARLETPQLPALRLAAGLDHAPLEPLAYRDGLREGAGVAYRRVAGLAPFFIVPDPPAAPLAALALDVLWVETGRPLDYNGPGFSLHLPEKARFFPGPLVLRTERTPGADSLPSMSDAVDVLPEGEVFDDRAVLSFDLSPEAVTPEAMGVYRWDRLHQRWSYEGGDLEDGNTRISIHFRRYGRFALLQDASPPQILQILPAPGTRTSNRRPALSARVEDLGKGLNFDGVEFELDGRRLDSEFDPDRGLSRVLDPPRLAPGSHHLKAVAVDLAGNSSPASESDFVILGR